MISPSDLIAKLENNSKNNRYKERINALKQDGFDTSIIEEGINDVNKVLDQKNGKSFVVYGEPQSGKTEFMIALTCQLLDKGFKTIFVLVNDNTELESQNFYRFINAQQLDPAPKKESHYIGLPTNQLKRDTKRVIFCRKNKNLMENLITNSRFFTDRVVIDDEADYATPDSNINKKDKDPTKINEKVSQLVQLDKGGVYIGVTATPGRLDLNNTLLNKSEDWVFLRSHSNYKGREFFFPTDKKSIQGKYILKTLREDYDDPIYLRKAALRFLLRTIFINKGKPQKIPYSMLIHTAGKTHDHEEDKKIIDDLLHKLDIKDTKTINELIKTAEELFTDSVLVEEIILDVLKSIGQSQVLIINSNKKYDRDNVLHACEPAVLFTFAIGGNIVSRGLTFKNLLSFFFSRNVKSKMTQNTYIQRARMFGNRPYAEHFELCVPKSIFENWGNVFEDHELSLIFAKSGDLAHVQGKTNRAADAASVDKENVLVENRETAVGSIFDLNDELENNFLSYKGDLSPVDFIEQLIDMGLLQEENFPSYLRQYINHKSPDGIKDQHLLFTTDSDNLKCIYRGSNTSYWDDELLKRTRGGLIQSIIKGRSNLISKKHFIFPVKSIDGTRGRFIYRSELGQTILKNLK